MEEYCKSYTTSTVSSTTLGLKEIKGMDNIIWLIIMIPVSLRPGLKTDED